MPAPIGFLAPFSFLVARLARTCRRRPALVLGAGLLVLLALSVRAEAAKDAAVPPLNQGPLIRVDERRWEFGEIGEKDKVRRAFRIRNDGTAPLRIKDIDTSCGCTIATPADSVLVPGQETTLEIVFDPKGKEGEIVQVVALTTNDPAEPRVDLVLHGSVIPDLRVEPRVLDFGDVRKGQTPSLSARLIAQKGVRFEVKNVTGADNFVIWKTTRIPSADGEVIELTATLDPAIGIGIYNRKAQINLIHPTKPVERIGVQAKVYSYFIPAEPRIDFLTVKRGRTLTREMKIEADGSRPYKITGAEADSPTLAPTVREEGKGYVLSVAFRTPNQPMHYSQFITLKTTDPDQPTIRIEARAAVL